MLKYLKKALGKDVKNFGIFFIILGCLLTLSILFTILLITIINVTLDYNIHEIPISNNKYRERSNNPGSESFRENQTMISYYSNNPKKPAYKYIDEYYKFLTEHCQINPSLLDERGNCQSGWRTGSKTGPKGYLKDYYPPIGWKGIGLKVVSMCMTMEMMFGLGQVITMVNGI